MDKFCFFGDLSLPFSGIRSIKNEEDEFILNYITLTKENLEKEHICCSMQDKKGCCGIERKKEWLLARMEDGLVFTKADLRGKVFIEYLPAEKAWAPISADNYILINCLWVAGAYKGQGIGKALLRQCLDHAKESSKYGVVILSACKKRPYLADAKFLRLQGFECCDSAEPYYELYCLRFSSDSPVPKFKECAKRQTCDTGSPYAIFYSNQCPYTEDYVRDVKQVAEQNGILLDIVKYQSCEEAQNAPIPSTTYSFFVNGRFVTHEILTVKSFLKICNDL
jgi:GNAT superfamily N-acetyltransferase